MLLEISVQSSDISWRLSRCLASSNKSRWRHNEYVELVVVWRVRREHDVSGAWRQAQSRCVSTSEFNWRWTSVLSLPQQHSRARRLSVRHRRQHPQSHRSHSKTTPKVGNLRLTFRLSIKRSRGRLPAGAQSSHLGQLSLPALRGRPIGKSSTSLTAGVKAGCVIPWQVTPCSSEIDFPWKTYPALTST